MSGFEPLPDLAPTVRFSDRAGDYARYRPDYPAAAIDAVLEGLGSPSGLRAADVGAGTGISARQLAARSVRVFAVEPNAEMRASAVPHALVTWQDGTAEATGIASGAVNLVICAQAFHWFRAEAAIAEFHRVLAKRGRLVVMWNVRDRSDALTGEYTRAIEEVGGEHPAEKRPFDPGVVPRSGLFEELRLETFPHAQELDREALIGRATSASYVPKSGPAFEKLKELLASAHERHRDERGLVTLRYVTEVWRAARL